MAKTRQQKEEELALLKGKCADAKTAVFVDYTGTNVEGATQLRNNSREVGAEYLVAKKTLLSQAATEAVEGFDATSLHGNLGVLFGFGDEVAPARIAKNFSKTIESFTVLAGVMEGKFIDSTKVNQLADLPSRDELLAKVVGSLNAPISGFVNVLAGNMRGLVTALKGIADSK